MASGKGLIKMFSNSIFRFILEREKLIIKNPVQSITFFGQIYRSTYLVTHQPRAKQNKTNRAMSLCYMSWVPPHEEEHHGRKYEMPERHVEKHVPLKDVHYDVTVIDRNAQIVLTQKFENDEDDKIEAHYKFPLSGGASVYSFEATNDAGETVVGVCKEKEEAKREYNDAIEQGDTAYYMEVSDNVFSMAIGGLSAKSGVTITIKFACELMNEGDHTKLRLTIPLSIAERYSPPYYEQSQSIAGQAAKAKQEAKPYDVTIDGDIIMTSEILGVNCYGQTDDDKLKSVESLTHGLKLSSMKSNSVHFEIRGLEDLTKDVAMVIERGASVSAAHAQALPPHVALQNPALRYCTAANIVPDFSKCPEPNPNDVEYIMLLDISGSMGADMTGDWSPGPGVQTRLDICKKAAKQFVGLIPNGASFQVVTFESSHDVCPLEDADGETLMAKKKFAIDWIDALTPRGGTEIYSALKHVYSTLDSSKNSVIVLITDGQIHNTTDVFRLVSKNPSTSIFTLGLGDDASEVLVRGIASQGNGQCALVGNGESADKDVLAKVRNLLAQSKSSLRRYQSDYDLSFDCPGDALLLPQTTLFENTDNTLYVFTAEPIKSVNFTTYHGAERTPHSQVFVPSVIDGDCLLHKIGGIKLISYLEAQEKSGAEKPSGSLLSALQVGSSADAKLKDNIVSTSIDLQVLSSHTAFIAVEKKVDPDTSGMVLREVPLQAKRSSYGGMPPGAAAAAGGAAMAAAAAAACPMPAGAAMAAGAAMSSGLSTMALRSTNNPGVSYAGASGSDEDLGDCLMKSAEPEPSLPKPDLVITVNFAAFAMSDMLTTENNECLAKYLQTLGITQLLEVGQIIELTAQGDPEQNGIYEIVGLGSNDEPWVLQRFA